MACMARPAATGQGPEQSWPWRSLQRADFAMALATPAAARSAHFSLHYRPVPTTPIAGQATRTASHGLSTARAPTEAASVNKWVEIDRCGLGIVVPKRHAPRAATRNLLKRKIRARVAQARPALPPGQWLVRLTAPFDARQFPSAASIALGAAVGAELEQVFARWPTR